MEPPPSQTDQQLVVGWEGLTSNDEVLLCCCPRNRGIGCKHGCRRRTRGYEAGQGLSGHDAGAGPTLELFWLCPPSLGRLEMVKHNKQPYVDRWPDQVEGQSETHAAALMPGGCKMGSSRAVNFAPGLVGLRRAAFFVCSERQHLVAGGSRVDVTCW
ncbi:hypothetical protein LX36DRAFT_430598 [Colletotrichum falcatum]|nr:hypothetical protein LX36DRAFT_430598 [Colletotrichum falcatum]